jgi:hypothetical protein
MHVSTLEVRMRPAYIVLAVAWLAVALPGRFTSGAEPSADCIPRLAMIPRPVDRLHYCRLSRRPGKDGAMERGQGLCACTVTPVRLLILEAAR